MQTEYKQIKRDLPFTPPVHLTSAVMLLQAVRKSADTGEYSLSLIIQKCEEPVKSELEGQRLSFDFFREKADELLDAMDEAGEDAPRTGMWLSVNVNAIVNSSSSHLAQMALQGHSMGVIEVARALKEYPDAPQECIELGRDMVSFMEGSMSRLKECL